MPCPSCSSQANPSLETQFIGNGGNGGNGGNITSLPNTTAHPSFKSEGEVSIINTGNPFVDFAYSVPFLVSATDSYITSLLSNEIIIGFQPTFFQIPYIYSYADNLINGNYNFTVDDQDNVTITTYKIPYQREFKEEIVTIVTYFSKESKILFHEIPREFSYNSVEQASIAYVEKEDGSLVGKLSIPNSFVTDSQPKISAFFIDLNIIPKTINDGITTTKSNSAAIQATPSATAPPPPSCKKQYGACPQGGSQCCSQLCGPLPPQYPSPVCII
jgi:hypothetical protein